MVYIVCAALAAALMVVVGGLIFMKINQKNPKAVTYLTGLSAGFLIVLIFMGILKEAQEMMMTYFTENIGWLFPLCVAAGIVIIILIERLIPVKHHHDVEEDHHHRYSDSHVFYITLCAFGLHSLFEFISMMIAGANDLKVGLLLGVVLGLHNIPIGFIIMAQLDLVEKRKKKIIVGMVILAIAEVALALICFKLLSFIITEYIQGILLAMTGGMMLYLFFDELLPGIYREGNQHYVNYSILAGIVFMMILMLQIAE